MTIVLTGGAGQLGWELARTLSCVGDVVALTREQSDLADDPGKACDAIERLRPSLVVNAAAYTAVDRAEQDERGAYKVNADAVGMLAVTARRVGALFVHYSTDYVFDGAKQTAYGEADVPNPLNVYGRSKLAGEQAVQQVGGDWLVFRTSWVFSHRGQNFLRTMLRLGSERERLSIVSDQRGAPTQARMLAELTAHAVWAAQRERADGRFESGLYHLTAAGETNWHEFATTIFREARIWLPGAEMKVREVTPISAKDYAVSATRPSNSLLSNERFDARFGLFRPDWATCMRQSLQDIAAAQGISNWSTRG